MATDNMNLNLAQCLKSATDFGVTHVHNVCAGTVTDVPWGALEWVLCIGLMLGSAVFIGLFGAMMFGIIKDEFFR